MRGWVVPPPTPPTKGRREFERERRAKVDWLIEQRLLASAPIRQALLKVPREDFIPPEYRDYAYLEVPLPLPGRDSTISCPHSYPLFYEPLGLAPGHRFLEVGTGSGYGAAVAREVVGAHGLVVSIEMDPVTLAFARANLDKAGYADIVLVEGDGGAGYPPRAPYDRIAITAACPAIPPPLIEQLRDGGKLIAPVAADDRQDLVLLEKTPQGETRMVICQVLYLSLKGVYGTRDPPAAKPDAVTRGVA
jgi:protein-L-isoaspartate(D-aspartate) O-methyltransferase